VPGLGCAAMPFSVMAQELLIAYDDDCMSPPDTQLSATGLFDAVDSIGIGTSTPVLQDLMPYDSVLVVTNCEPADPVVFGDLLADYVDAGGNVVLTTYATSDPWSVQGRIMTSGYAPLPNSATLTCITEPLVILEPGDPIFSGVNVGAMTIDTNCNMADSALDTGATLIAEDSAGINMIARNSAGNVMVFNIFATPNGSNNDEFWLLLANSLQGEFAGSDLANFKVTKTFSNGSTGDVEVTLTCNGGIPLEQSFTISGGGPGVTFTVTNLPDAGANCEVTESGADGYTASFNDGAGCDWTGVTGGTYECAIENTPDPTMVEVMTEFMGVEDPNIDTSFETTIECMNVSDTSTGGYGSVTVVTTADTFSADWYPDPDLGADCTVTLEPMSSAVEGDMCEFSFMLGDEEAGCTVVGSVFFEGIPTLSQYGMAIMALLMLGVGFVGFRRFV